MTFTNQGSFRCSYDLTSNVGGCNGSKRVCVYLMFGKLARKNAYKAATVHRTNTSSHYCTAILLNLACLHLSSINYDAEHLMLGPLRLLPNPL